MVAYKEPTKMTSQMTTNILIIVFAVAVLWLIWQSIVDTVDWIAVTVYFVFSLALYGVISLIMDFSHHITVSFK